MSTQKKQKQQQHKQQKQQQQQQQKDTEIFASCSFSSLGLDQSVCDQLKERLDFETPTQVQAKSIPVILSGRHVLVNAATGTGKTIAYLAPVIHHLHKYEPRIQRTDGTFDIIVPASIVTYSPSATALVLVPTRELCMQVYEILQKLLHRFHWIVPGYLMGGENRSKEKARLRKGISVLVATPGRLLDHFKNTSSFLYTNLRWLIVDEADRILELGFGKEIQDILNILGSRQNKSEGQHIEASRFPEFQRQNLLFSATLDEKVNHLAKISLENPAMIGITEQKPHSVHFEYVGSDEEDVVEHISSGAGSSAGDYNLPSQLVQKYVKVPCGARLAVLLCVLKDLFEREVIQKVVVFFSTCDAVDFHYSLLKEFRWSSDSMSETEQKRLFLSCNTFRLHGNMEQEERKTTFQALKTEKSALLLSTDVAARGLDFPKVRCIIQYDSPGEATEYVHRVGRTARLGQKGDSLLFLQPIESDYLKDLEKHGVSLLEYPLHKVLDSFPVHGKKHHALKFVSTEAHPCVVTLQKALESYLQTQAKMQHLAKAAFVSWVRAYTAHRGELKRIFMVKKLHLGHVAKSFGLKDQPSLVVKSVHKQLKKRKKYDQKQKGQLKKRKVAVAT